jgi:Tfp pilus assembly protein PilV
MVESQAGGPTSARRRRPGTMTRWRAGVTLTEVVVASSLLIIAIVPILKALSSATLTGTKIERKTRSLALAQAKLDEIRARSIYHYDVSYRESSSDLEGGYLCDISDDEDPHLRLVTVAVGYDANADGSLSPDEVDVSLTTYMARRL